MIRAIYLLLPGGEARANVTAVKIHDSDMSTSNVIRDRIGGWGRHDRRGGGGGWRGWWWWWWWCC
jgi:hypothetical protein